MAKYSQAKIKECEEWIMEHGLMDYGGAKLKDFLAAMGIHHKCYYLWLQKDEFRAAVERAKQYFKEHLCRDLVQSLADAAKGGERETSEEHIEYRQNPADHTRPIIHRKSVKKSKIFIKPDVAAAIFLLCNLDPEHYQNSQRNDITIKKPTTAEDAMTDEEIAAEIERLEKLQK
ncbi:hypothetical protein [Muribaculum intestinale]|uniref:Terminase small subunit n=1 Tax=Muribaculum intestinale TaxID=1796646 RepID=A0A4S2FXK2_9BACT|nr:hypothetical protein [Muribaculum intestinale]MYM12396.1 hypothetical protein [Muribaculum intestinale]TGY74185.1 hypothetical protein E5333_07100 [Muribaculum intestinale]